MSNKLTTHEEFETRRQAKTMEGVGVQAKTMEGVETVAGRPFGSNVVDPYIVAVDTRLRGMIAAGHMFQTPLSPNLTDLQIIDEVRVRLTRLFTEANVELKCKLVAADVTITEKGPVVRFQIGRNNVGIQT